MPKSNQALWEEKFRLTVKRDRANVRQLRRMGWSVMIVWECRLRDESLLKKRIVRFLDG